jgi:hypothetical protein
MLLLFKTSFVHILEGTRRIIYEFIKDLHLKTSIIDKRILVVLDDVKDRYYPFWASRIIDQSDDSSKIDFQMMDSKSIDELISSTCVQLFKVGIDLGGMNKVKRGLLE